MKKLYTLLLGLLPFHAFFAQNCVPNPNCFDAPIVCGAILDGLSYATEPPTFMPILLPPFYPCGTLENNQWIGFVPCKSNVALQIEVGNCQGSTGGGGIQAVLYEMDQCDNFNVVSPCLEQIFPFSSNVLFTSGLVPGNVYYLMLDGFAGDVCEYTIHVLDGIETVPSQGDESVDGYITASSPVICLNQPVTFTLTPPYCIGTSGNCPTAYPFEDCSTVEWNFPPGTSYIGPTGGLSVTVVFTQPVAWTVTAGIVTDDNCDCLACGSCPPGIILPLNIIILTPQFEELPPLTLCVGEHFQFCGDNITMPGTDTLSCQVACTLQTQIVSSYPVIDAALAGQPTFAANGTALLDASPSQLSGNTVVQWQGPGIQASNEHELSPTVSAPGSYSLLLTDTVSGCTDSLVVALQPGFSCSNPNNPIAPSDSCYNAPPFCSQYLSNFCSNNAGYTANVPGNLGTVLGCSIENNQWLTFEACADTAWFEFTVGNCLNAGGLQFAILQTNDCDVFTAMTTCFSIADGNTDTLVATGLVPGGTYYLMVDGLSGDICQWEVNTLDGVSGGGFYHEENTPGFITGDCDVCLDTPAGVSSIPVAYTATKPECEILPGPGVDCPFPIDPCSDAPQQFSEPFWDTLLVEIDWDTIWHIIPPTAGYFVNNDSITDTVYVVWTMPGNHFVDADIIPTDFDTIIYLNNGIGGCTQLCGVEGLCDIEPKPVGVGAPISIFQNYELCQGECITVFGQTICSPGVYDFINLDQYGCEQTFTALVTPAPFLVETLEVELTCAEPSYSFCGQTITAAGFYVCPFSCGEQQLTVTENFVGETFDLGLIELCPGECFQLSGNQYCDPGPHVEQILNPATGCFDTYIFSIFFFPPDPPLLIGPVTELCDATNLFYSVSFNIVSGTPPYSVNGNFINGNFYQSNPIPSGNPYAFLVSDFGACGAGQTQVQGAYSCQCPNFSGTMQLDQLTHCEGEMAASSFNNDAVLAPGDLLEFILHTGSGTSLGNIIGTNTSGIFGFVPGLMAYGQTYYISPVTGNDAGGIVDMADACLSVGAGQPVVFYETPDLDILPPAMLDCNATSVFLTAFVGGGSGNFSYQWAGPGVASTGTPNLAVAQAGTFSCTVTDNLTGCTDFESVAVTSDTSPPNLSVTNGELTCDQSIAILQATSSTQGASFEWTFPDGNVLTGAAISTNIPGIYTVVAIAPNGCTAAQPSQVVDNGSPPDLFVTEGELNCAQQTVTLDATSTSPNVTFTWSFPDGSQQSGPSISTALAGTYAVVASLSNGCSTEMQTLVIDNSNPPDLAAGNGEITCLQPSVLLMASSSFSDVLFTWSLPDGTQQTGSTINTSQPGTYTVVAIAANGCTAETQTAVTADLAGPNIGVTEGTLSCAQDEVWLAAASSDPAPVFAWQLPDGSLATGDSVLASSVGEYLVTVTGENGCSTEAVAQVVQGPAPALEADLELQPPACFGESDGLIVVNGFSGGVPPYSFTVNDQPPPSNLMENLPPGEYLIAITDANGCKDSTVVDFPEPEEITADLGVDLFIKMGASATLNLVTNQPASEIHWTGPGGQTWDGVSSLTVTPMEGGLYGVTVTDANGCSATDEVQVFVEGGGQVFIPSAFSPNGDGQNDYFTIYAGGDVKLIRTFRVFDRWGENVFEGKDLVPNEPELGWDGKLKGKNMKPAVFVYMAEVEFVNGSTQMLAGDVVLVR
ncbi:MAG: gliding motility-associated C-terminal domain-containing protein [Lewinellaceae bacterium]|nr:gliding motility-associated C-terminal domain-containing protein [Lewinellaceae bacterium]